MTEIRPARALLAVYDKTGVVDLARGLTELGVTLVSSGVRRPAREAACLSRPSRRSRIPGDAGRPGQDVAPASMRGSSPTEAEHRAQLAEHGPSRSTWSS